MARQKIVVLTGAGISADSGLKTFRDEDGLWEGYAVEEVATPDAFKRHPELVLNFYNERRRQMQATQPNAAHYALVELEKSYDVSIITQNVDDLHERAGSHSVLHLHGELNKACSSVNKHYVVPCHQDQTMNDVDEHGQLMRPYIVWFGEDVPLMEEAIRLTQLADILVVIGTSMQVYPAASLVHYISNHTSCYLVDPKPPEDIKGIEIIAKRAKDGVPQLVTHLLQDALS